MKSRYQIAMLVLAPALLMACTPAGMHCSGPGVSPAVCVKVETSRVMQLNASIVQTITVLAPDADIPGVQVGVGSGYPDHLTFSGPTSWTLDLKQDVPAVLTTTLTIDSYGYYGTDIQVGLPGQNLVSYGANFDLQPPSGTPDSP